MELVLIVFSLISIVVCIWALLQKTKAENEVKEQIRNNAFLQGQIAELKIKFEEQNTNEVRLTKLLSDISNESVLKQGKIIQDQQEKRLEDVLKPLKEKLKDFEKKVEDNQTETTKQSLELLLQIRNLTTLNQTVTQKTEDLTNALKGSNKFQGNWGEIILERVLESSGLVKDREYKTQFVTKNQHQETIKPDAVIFLPEDKNIIIDSKVSLKAYEAYCTAEEGSIEKEMQLKNHLESLKSHIKLLAQKDYHTALGLNTPDFTLLFIPIESGFALTISQDSNLFNYAWERKIVLVSPSTLLATLRTIASVWKIENQTRNAIEIAAKAGDLYDKFVGFTNDLQEVGKHLHKAEVAHQKAFSKLNSGRGNLVSKVESLRKMGINASKKLDISHDESEEEEN
jgi:DNA recombination protein RmuC